MPIAAMTLRRALRRNPAPPGRYLRIRLHDPRPRGTPRQTESRRRFQARRRPKRSSSRPVSGISQICSRYRLGRICAAAESRHRTARLSDVFARLLDRDQPDFAGVQRLADLVHLLPFERVAVERAQAGRLEGLRRRKRIGFEEASLRSPRASHRASGCAGSSRTRLESRSALPS